jgi:solute:Na+ symporter, SSS family
MKTLDWAVVGLYSLCALAIGIYFTRRASRGIEGYFMAGRSLPWWAIGFSAVATFTSAGSASAFTMLIFSDGLLGNWWWWIPWVIWMPLVAVIWSKFWRRLKIVSTAEFVQVRYGGRAASVFRSIAAIYFSFGWAVLLMAYVTGWLTHSVGPILGWSNATVIAFAASLTLVYTVLGGLLGAVYSEIFQFALFILANLIFIPFLIHRMGGLSAIYSAVAHNAGTSFFAATPPGGDFTKLTILALILQGLFFAASPAGGEGFTAQKFMAARNEFHAQVGQLFNALLSLVVRVIPFFFLGLIAAAAFPRHSIAGEQVWGELVRRYSFPGLTGLLVAGELASYQSAISTEMNWGASYLINDLYKRLIKKNASDRHYAWAGRIATFLLLILAVVTGYVLVHEMMSWFLFINNVMIAFILPLAWLRFFWWRLNIWGEIAALVIGLPMSYIIWFPLGYASRPFWQGFLMIFGAGWIVIIAVTLLTPPEKKEVLENFYRLCRPPGVWGEITRVLPEMGRRAARAELRRDIYECGLGIVFCATSTAATADFFGKHWWGAIVNTVVAGVSFFIFMRRWKRRGVFGALRGSSISQEDAAPVAP